MARVLGLGGVFFKAKDPEKLGAWYKEWLDLPVEHPYGAILKHDGLPADFYSVWSPFKQDTTYFAPSDQSFMINLIVDDLDGCLIRVKDGGAEVMPKVEDSEYGRFGWFIDPEGNKVELWQPPA
jgi:catechol 2,3-dioxygenase-like lactoylglutathione lyase family enzyme